MWGMPKKGVDGVRMAASLGFAGIAMDISLLDAPTASERGRKITEYRQLSDALQIAYPTLSVEQLNEIGLTRPTGSREGQQVLDICKRGIEIAAELGVEVLQFPSFNDGAIRTEEDFLQTCEKFSILSEEARLAGVKMASENDLDLSWSARMLKEVDTEQFGILFDTQNYYLNHIKDSAALFVAIAEHVLQIHIKDGVGGVVSNALLGQGESGFFQTAEAIKEQYQGEWILIETYYDRPPFSASGDPASFILQDIDTYRAIFVTP